MKVLEHVIQEVISPMDKIFNLQCYSQNNLFAFNESFWKKKCIYTVRGIDPATKTMGYLTFH